MKSFASLTLAHRKICDESAHIPTLDELIADDLGFQRTVVRLVTSAWHTNRGIFTQRALLFLKRDSIGFNILEEDCANIGAPEVTQNILFENHPDGLYEVVTCNESRDWESGYIEEYDYQLIPYVREPR